VIRIVRRLDKSPEVGYGPVNLWTATSLMNDTATGSASSIHSKRGSPRVFLSLILICLLWAGLHFYVISRLLSIPFIAHHVPARLLIPQFAVQVDCASCTGEDNLPVSCDTFRTTLFYQIVQLRNHFAQTEYDLVMVKITKQARD
jgi:hypothetical protein